MADLLRGTPLPTVPMPERSNAPKVITREVVIERTLRGEDGQDGQDGNDGRDGKNAFPDGLVVLSVPYTARVSRPGSRVRGTPEVRYSDLEGVTDSDLVLPAGRKYRVTVSPELGGNFAPTGTSIALCEGPVYLDKMIPEAVEVPLFLSRLPDFRLSVHVEYMKDVG